MPSNHNNRLGDQVKVNDFWNFDTATGLGPFNCFYAAINLVDYTLSTNPDYANEAPISQDAGEVAYVLDPYSITKKTISGTSYTPAKYNIMLVIPTVYWHSVVKDGANYLYMSSDPGFFTADKSEYHVVDGSDMLAYAHTFSKTGGKNWATDTVYPYLALSVYEASTIGSGDSAKLVSQPGMTPAGSQGIDAFRTMAQRNSVTGTGDDVSGYYGLWNYYGWTLYKIMGYTIMGDKDSQYVMGMGVITNSSTKKTGLTDSAYTYSTRPPSGMSMNGKVSSTAPVCLLLENAWGNSWEMIDGACAVRTNATSTLYTDNRLQPVTIASSAMSQGAAPIKNQSQPGPLAGTSTGSEDWDAVTDYWGNNRDNYATGRPNTPSKNIYYDIQVNDLVDTGGGTGDRLIMVGCCTSSGNTRMWAGIACYSPHLDITYGGSGFVTSRLAYVMNNPYSVTYAYGATGDSGTGTLPTDTKRYASGQDAVVLGNTGGMTNTDPLKRFIGWEADGKVYSPGEKITLSRDITVKSYWANPVITFLFAPGSGQGVMDSQTIGYDSPTYLRENSFKNPGYSFDKWVGTASDGTSYTFTDKELLDFALTPTSTSIRITLTAQWIGNYTLSFDIGSGDADPPVPRSVMATDSVLLPGYNGASHGHGFIGWFYEGSVYDAGDRFDMPYSDVTMVAVYKTKDKEHDWEEEDEDDILDILRANQTQQESSSERTMHTIVTAAAGVLVSVTACLILIVWRRRAG